MPFLVVNDTLVPQGLVYADLTPYDIHVRNAFVLITIVAPLIGSFFVYKSAFRDVEFRLWSYPTLAILWMITVGIVGVGSYIEELVTTRETFILAIFHTQLEVLINSLLLKLSPQKALFLSFVWGFVLYTVSLAEPSISSVYFAVAILGGAGDLLIAFLFAYGKRWLYALSALFHVVSAVTIFVSFVIPIRVAVEQSISFVALWLYIGFVTASIMRDSGGKESNGHIALPEDVLRHVEGHSSSTQRLINPLYNVTVPKIMLAVFIGVGLVGSTAITLLLYHIA